MHGASGKKCLNWKVCLLRKKNKVSTLLDKVVKRFKMWVFYKRVAKWQLNRSDFNSFNLQQRAFFNRS